MSFFADISLFGAVICLCILGCVEWVVSHLPKDQEAKSSWLHPAE